MATKASKSGAHKAARGKQPKVLKTKPQAQNGDLHHLPAALAPLVKLRHWVLWRFEKKGDDWTKVPKQPNGSNASNDNPATWSSYKDVIAVADKFDGIGFCLLGTDIAAFDIDKCRTSDLHPWASDLVTKCSSYAEVTPSGTGLRIIGYGTGSEVHRKQPVADGVSLETYRKTKRYITITGNQLPNTPQQLVNIDAHIDATVAELDANKKNKKSKSKGDKTELPAALRHMLYIPNLGKGMPTGGYPSRSQLFYAFVCEALRRGIDENVIVEHALDPAYTGNAIHAHVQENGGEDYVKRQIERAANEMPDVDDKGRTLLLVIDGKLDETWRATQKALVEHNCPVYVRGGRLVQPLWRWEQAHDDRQVLSAHFKPYNLARLQDVTAHRAVQFQKRDNRRRGQIVDIDPPKAVITQLLEAGYWPAFPTVVGIINAPTMRKDGSLLTEPGYDKATQLWYKSSGEVVLSPIPEHPSKADAKKALAELSGLLDGFPFEDGVARSVALAGMMTTALRGALPAAVPIFLVTATEPRTGKTYLVCLTTVLATGHIPPSTAGASEDRPEEIEKRIETAALSGRPILHLNNLPNGMVLDSSRLAELCTEGYVTIRMLGRHEEGLCDCRATTAFLNGNNVRVAGDLVLRTLECRLDAKSEEPERRTFDSDPMAAVRKDRGKYLATIFTIVRAFIKAKYPKPKTMHSVAGFEEWSRLVQQPLMWLGMADPCGNIARMRAMDIQTDELQKLHKVLRDIFKAGDKFTVAMCSRKADEMRTTAYGKPEFWWPELRDLMTVYGKVNEKSFGRLLARHRGRRTDGGWHYTPVGILDGSMAYLLVGPTGAQSPTTNHQPPSPHPDDDFM